MVAGLNLSLPVALPIYTAVAWAMAPATGAGSINVSGLYTAPASVNAQQTVTITAKGQADGVTTGAATLTLSPPITVSVGPATATVYGGGTQLHGHGDER